LLSYPDQPQTPTFATLVAAFGARPGLPFADVLTQQDIEDACQQHDVHFAHDEADVCTPALTLWTFVSQCLAASKSCVAAVARAMVLRIALGLAPCAAATGAYCKARAKLPEAFLQQLALQVGTGVEDQAADCWRWHHKRVLLADGTELSMPDTEANQRVYPQPRSQRPGLGFPQMRLVVLLTFATAGLVGAAMGPCAGKETGETALFRSLLQRIRAGDVVVADRYYCSYWMVALLLACGADVAFRLHQSRHCDFRRGRRLGQGDHVVTWDKPERPDWLDEETYGQLPAYLIMREVRVTVRTPGCRTRNLVVATTLLDAELYPQEDIADLYHQRWHVELDIRNLKTTLKMDVLSCKTPEMVRKEVWTHLLGYNLVRKVMAQAALEGKRTPRQLSFAGAQQTCNAMRFALVLAEARLRGVLASALLIAVATHQVGNRPNRVEPREVKRRRYKRYLRRPRAQRRAELLQV
jgi:DDE family transposase